VIEEIEEKEVVLPCFKVTSHSACLRKTTKSLTQGICFPG